MAADSEDAAPEDLTIPSQRLSQVPDWVYLLREIYDVYLRSSAGGSSKIRSHQRVVREQISRVLESDPPIARTEPVTKPVCAHLKRALDQGRLHRNATLIRAIESVSDQFSWMYGYERVPRHLTEKFAYTEIVAPTGPIVYPKLILGLVLFAPKCIYPAHSHDGITESYFCLSGSVSENDDGVYAPGSLIFNPPGRNHRITVADREPCLLAYAWAGSEEKLGGQKLVFTRSRARDIDRT